MKDCREDLPYIEPRWDAGQSAREKLKEDANFAIRNDIDRGSEKHKKLKDLVQQLWGNLNQKAWASLQHRSESQAPRIENGSQRLYGWEYMDVIWNNLTTRKQIRFNQDWVQLTKAVVVLLGKSFGELVRPAPSTQICSALSTKKTAISSARG